MNQPITTCKNCGNSFRGKFCNNCGEKQYSEKDKSIVAFFDEGFHFLTHFEGKFFTTLKTFFKTPGKVSIDYTDGVRKKYFKPLSFFLLLVILYLIFPFFEGLNMKMEYYKSQRFFGGYAETKIQQKLVETGLSMEALSEKFKSKSEKASKFLLISIVPFTALVFYLLTFRKRRFFFDHMIFSTEINSVYLLWGFLILPLLLGMIIMIAKWITGSNNIYANDGIISWLIYIPLVMYTARAGRRFYGFNWWQLLLFCIAFYVAHILIVYSLYKFLLFVTVIHQIH
jgi:Protein of unknown function (DUF3667)